MNTSKLMKIAASLGLAAAFALPGAITVSPVFAEEGSIETIDVGTVDGVKENDSNPGITVSENGTIVSGNTGNTNGSSAQSSTGASSGKTDSYNSGETVMSTYSSMSSTNDVLNSIPGKFMDTNTTVEGMSNKITSKGGELVDGIRRVALVICVGAFIVGAISMIGGAISHKGMAGPGLKALIISAIAFAIIYYAPQILMWFTAWVVS